MKKRRKLKCIISLIVCAVLLLGAIELSPCQFMLASEPNEYLATNTDAENVNNTNTLNFDYSMFLNETGDFDIDAFTAWYDALSDEECRSFCEQYGDGVNYVITNTIGGEVDTPMLMSNSGEYVTAHSTKMLDFGGLSDIQVSWFNMSDGNAALCVTHSKLRPSDNQQVADDTAEGNSVWDRVMSDELYNCFYFGWLKSKGTEIFSDYSNSEWVGYLAVSLIATEEFYGSAYSLNTGSANIQNRMKAYANSHAGEIPNAASVTFSKPTLQTSINGGVFETEYVTFGNADLTSQTASITLPANVTAVVRSGGTEVTHNPSTTFFITEGNEIKFQAPLSASGSYTIQATSNVEILSKYARCYYFGDDFQRLLAKNVSYPTTSLNFEFNSTVSVAVAKESETPSLTNGNSCYSLQGAVFGLYLLHDDALNDINRLATLTTDASGRAQVNDLELPASGMFFIKELAAPQGFEMNNAVYPVAVSAANDNSNPATITIKDSPLSDPMMIVVRKVIKYADGTVDVGKPIAGAVFEVKHYGSSTVTGTPDATWYFITDANGEIKYNPSWLYSDATHHNSPMMTSGTGDYEMALGCITIQEIIAPTGYIVDSTISTQYLTTAHASLTLEERLNEATVTNTPIPVYLRVVKIDKDTTNPILSSNAKFKIWDYQNNQYLSFVVSGNTVDTFESKNGVMMTPEPISIGKYRIEEVQQPDGYYDKDLSLPDGIVSQVDIDVTAESYISYIDEYGNNTGMGVFSVTMENTPIYAQLEIQKKAEQRIFDDETKQWIVTEVPLANIDFGIFAKTDMYSVDDGTLIYAADTLVETITTDSTGYATSSDTLLPGIYYVRELNQPVEYIPAEDFEIVLNDDADLIDVTMPGGNIKRLYYKNKAVLNELWVPQIKTKAKDNITGTNVGVIGKQTTIVDTVNYKCLIVGREYSLTATPILKSTKDFLRDKDGSIVSNTIKFTPTSSDGSVDISVTFDSSLLQGDKVVMFERVEYNDDLVCLHEDIEDYDQTVFYPDVGTQARDSITGDNVGTVDQRTTLYDTVLLSNVVVGETYTISGVLMDRDTGMPILQDGNNITSTTTYTATKTSESVELKYDKVDTSLLKGKSVVFFETVYVNGIEVCSEADINNENQTIYFPEVKTTALDKATGTHYGTSVNENVTEIDTVYAYNLQIGKQYEVKGILMDADTKLPILDNGKQITASLTFVADKKDMVLSLEFICPTYLLHGVTTVCFEDLYHNDKLIYSHSDIDDKFQQVKYPACKSTATSLADGTHYGQAVVDFKLNDLVEYINLKPNTTYVCKGMLMNLDTGAPLMINNSAITSETSFRTTENVSSSVNVLFTFDATSFAGKDVNVVCYEWIYEVMEDGSLSLVTQHVDLHDANQLVKFPSQPKTGDLFNIKLIFILIGVSFVGMFTCIFIRKRKLSK